MERDDAAMFRCLASSPRFQRMTVQDAIAELLANCDPDVRAARDESEAAAEADYLEEERERAEMTPEERERADMAYALPGVTR